MAAKKDPTQSMRLKASRYPNVNEGTACTQSSFKTGKKAFLFVGMQGGRYKAMFKLKASMAAATKLAKKAPNRFNVGTTAWVTARFTAEEPMPKKLWEKWLDESYALSAESQTSGVKKKSAKKKTLTKKTTTRVAKKKVAKKKR